MKINQALSIKPDVKWFKQLPKFSPNNDVPSADVVFALKAEAENLLDSEVKVYHRLKENKRDKDFVWIKKIQRAGTLSDKISAHTLLIQDSPVYNLSSLETLIGMVNTKGKRECLMAMDSLRDLFIGDLLIEDRKLKYFNEQPLSQIDNISDSSHSVTRKRCLILWLFENILKGLYKKFLTCVDQVSHDTIEKTKMKSVSVMHKLLEENPEEEQFLLDHLVNKIGDPIAKIGSHVCFLLGKLLNTHKHMKAVVVQEVERLIFRPNLAERAKYYSLCFLNQIILSHDDFKIANQLILIYFSQFKLFVKKGEVNNKMMSALLSGVARAYPYAKLRDNIVMDQMDAMYRLVHLVSFNISIQALMLIFQVLDSSDSVSDRFYGALYRKLLDNSLANSSKQAFFLNLVYRALKKDVAVVRIKAFVKRLLQVALYQPPNLQCGILVLISEVSKLHPNLLEIKHSIPVDSDSDEHYEDVVNEEDKATVKTEKDKVKREPGSSWVFKHESKKQKTKSAYDFDCRNPLHANPASHMWELLFLKNCYHPSVSLFANQVSTSTEIKYSGDPLLDFTNARFLDRFVYRNPKKVSENLETNPTTRVFGSRKLKASAPKQLHVTSNEYLQQKAGKVPEDEKFIYQYLRNRSVSAKTLKDDSDLDSVGSDEFEQLLDSIHPEDDGEDSLNFAKELGMQKAKKRKAEDSEDESADDFDDDEEGFDGDLDDEEIEFDDDAFGDLDDEDLCEEDFVGGKSKKPPKKKSKDDGLSLSDGQLLADADEFSALLEENAGTKFDTLSGQAFKIKDKSAAKQIAWEMERDRFIKRQKWQKRKKSFNRSKKSRN